MSSCYKCGRELPEGGVECESGCGRGAVETAARTAGRPQFSAAEIINQSSEIDWDKVKTMADVALVLSILHSGVRFLNGSPAAIALKKFLKP